MIKHSRQRDAILEYLHSTKSHPTAETVYENVRESIPNISLGTVYRNLNMLADAGDILRLSCGGTSDRYDGNPEQHYHFLCRECGNVSDLEMEGLSHINVIAGAGKSLCFSSSPKSSGGRIPSSSRVFSLFSLSLQLIG